MRTKACNILLVLLQTEEIYWSKLSSESIKIPSKVSFELVLIEASPIDTSGWVLEIKNKWHFPRLALKRLYWNQCKKLLETDFSSEINVWVSLAQEYGVVSSA